MNKLFDDTIRFIEGESTHKSFNSKIRLYLKEIGRQGIRNGTMEVPLRAYSKAFSTCLLDYNGQYVPKSSKIYSVYLIANLQMCSYFLSNTRQLCKNILKVLDSRELPPIDSYPSEDRLMFYYYSGLYYLSEDHLEEAYSSLTKAFNFVNIKHSLGQKILYKLLPLKILKGFLPKESIIEDSTYKDLLQAVRTGNLVGFKKFILSNEQSLMEQDTLYAFEKIEFVVYRTLLKQVYLGLSSNAQVKIDVFKKMIQFSLKVELTDVQYFTWLSNLIEKGYLRSNIYLKEDCIAFDPNNPFPALNSIVLH
eukprot:NODE_609_length_5433_cov_1.015186.p3 type:complete len:307 gc:universal NODE_609_length_5433_cov_1.015186:3370-2450(-)